MERLTNRETRLAKGGKEPTMLDIVNKLADYEDAEEQGLFLKLPCKIGDDVYTKEEMIDFMQHVKDEIDIEDEPIADAIITMLKKLKER